MQETFNPNSRLTEYRDTDGGLVSIAWVGTRRDVARFRAGLFKSEMDGWSYGRLPDGRYITGSHRVMTALNACFGR